MFVKLGWATRTLVMWIDAFAVVLRAPQPDAAAIIRAQNDMTRALWVMSSVVPAPQHRPPWVTVRGMEIRPCDVAYAIERADPRWDPPEAIEELAAAYRAWLKDLAAFGVD